MCIRDSLYNGQDMNEDKAPFYKEGVAYGHLQVTADGESMAVRVDGGSRTGYAYINLQDVYKRQDLYCTDFQGTNEAIPDDTVIETEDNRLGHIKGGAEIEYAPEFYEAKDDMGNCLLYTSRCV